MPEDLEAAFHQKALEIYETAKRECRYNATRFLQKIDSFQLAFPRNGYDGA
jgi:5-methylcytosine-specific restriction enzyme A